MRFYLKTFGCQMNELDSELVRQKLKGSGFEEVVSPHDAEVVLVNTCAVRSKAEKRALKFLYEKKRDGKITVALGCVAQLRGEDLFNRGADLVIGPRDYLELERVLKRYLERRKGERVFIKGASPITCSRLPLRRTTRSREFSSYITIEEGCDKVCSFCVVPKTRGREISRPREDILREAQHLQGQGVIEITLLGQNVDSYYHEGTDFADLLNLLDNKTSFYRIRFTTSHPSDMTYKVIKVIKNSKRITRWIHLPLQAGSTKVLREMNRGYTKEEYLALARMIRETIPGVTISTDLMVGFPGETEEDFEDTLDVVEKVRFENAYTFIYSPRPGTAAYLREDVVPKDVSGRRLRVLIEVVNKRILERRREMLGRNFELLIEGPSRKNSSWSSGRTDGNITCVIPGNYEPGTILDATIVEIRGLTPVAEVREVLRKETPLVAQCGLQ